MVSFNTTMRKVSKMFQWPKCLSKNWLEYISEKTAEVTWPLAQLLDGTISLKFLVETRLKSESFEALSELFWLGPRDWWPRPKRPKSTHSWHHLQKNRNLKP